MKKSWKKQRQYDLKRDFSITEDFYNQRLQEQEYVCHICKSIELSSSGIRGTVRQLAVDHDKKTNMFRGLLCGNCNLGLGNFQDNILILESAIKYLKQNYSTNNPTYLKGRKVGN